jgi:hypothetical protein
MRRESSTVVVLVGDAGPGLLAEVSRSSTITVARAAEPQAVQPETAGGPASRPGWESGALALREAKARRSTYVIVPDDPLADVAARWRGMWDVSAGLPGAAAFEESAADALAAWQRKQFELPDYYLVIAPPQHAVTGPDLYLGPLRAVRPRRVAIAGTADSPDQAAGLLGTLRSLDHGPWWPPLDDLLDAARRFFADDLAATPQRTAQ